MKRYTFTITISAEADNPHDAWLEAVTALSMDPGLTPDESEYETEEVDHD